MKPMHIACWLIPVLFLLACSSDELPRNLQTNEVPGHLFPTEFGYEEEERIVFPQIGNMSLNPFFIKSMMVPEEYQDHTGPAPEKSFKVTISSDDRPFAAREKELSINAKDIEAKISFESGYGDLTTENTSDAEITVTGKLTSRDTTDNMIHYAGKLDISVKLPDKGVLSFCFTDLYDSL